MRTILVTGGASGLGKEIVKKLSIDNIIWFTYNQSRECAIALESELRNVKAFHCDFSSRESVKRLCDKIETLELDVLVNNAMTGFEKKHFHKLEVDYFEKSFCSNILSTIQLTSKAIGFFRKKKDGKIITILSSVLKEHPPIGWSEYLAQKAYLRSLTKSWAAEYAKHGIVSNTISPAFMNTNLHNEMDDRELEIMSKKHPIGNLLTPKDTCEAIAYLVNANKYINGVDLVINAAESVL